MADPIPETVPPTGVLPEIQSSTVAAPAPAPEAPVPDGQSQPSGTKEGPVTEAPSRAAEPQEIRTSDKVAPPPVPEPSSGQAKENEKQRTPPLAEDAPPRREPATEPKKLDHRRLNPATESRIRGYQRPSPRVQEPAAPDITASFAADRDKLALDNFDAALLGSRLLRERLLLLFSRDDDVLDAAAHLILRRPEFRDHAKRAVLFDKPTEQQPGFEALEDAQSSNNDLVIVVYAVNRGCERFLAGVPTRGIFISQRRQELRSRKKTVLILITSDMLRSAPDLARSECAAPEIPFLAPLLQKHFEGKSEAMLRAFTWARENLPERDMTVEVFDERLYRLFRKGRVAVDDEYRRISPMLDKPDAFTLPAEIPDAAGLVDDNEPLRNTVVFLATYFEGLSAEDFQRVLQLLLRDQTIAVVTSPSVPAQGTTPAQPAMIETRTLWQVWTQQRQKVLKQAALVITPSDRTVDFMDPILRDEVRKVFESDHYFLHDEMFWRVMDSGLVFDGSSAVSAAAAEIVADRIERDPKGLGRECVIECFRRAAPSLGLQSPPAPERELLLAVVGLPPARVTALLARMAGLLDILLARGLEESVESALVRLFDFAQHGLALKLMHRMNGRFTGLWLRILERLLNEGGAAVAAEACRYIAHLARRREGDPAGLILGICKWLPDDLSELKSSSQLAALNLMLDLSEYSFAGEGAGNPIAIGLMGADPNDFAGTACRWLFRPELDAVPKIPAFDPQVIHRDEREWPYWWFIPRDIPADAGDEHGLLCAEIFVRWLDHYTETPAGRSDGEAPPRHFFRALLIADCCLSLTEPSTGELSDLNAIRLDALLAAVSSKLSRPDPKALLAQWRAMDDALREARAAARDPWLAPSDRRNALIRRMFVERLSRLRDIMRLLCERLTSSLERIETEVLPK